MIGVSTADNLAVFLWGHRDHETLAWSEEWTLEALDDEPVPLGVPPWWWMRHKAAMFYTGSGRGDHARRATGTGSATPLSGCQTPGSCVLLGRVGRRRPRAAATDPSRSLQAAAAAARALCSQTDWRNPRRVNGMHRIGLAAKG